MNEVFQIKTHLHYGATVYVSCFNNSTKFYMFSNGISFKTVISIAQTQGPFDSAMCLFVITPVMKFQSEEFLEKILNNRYSDQAQGIDYDEKKTKVFIDQFEFQLKQNNKLKDQQINFPIKYNESFMLQHVFSSKYLCFAKNSDNNQYNIQLSQIPTSSCIFNLKACFNYQKDINTYVPFNSAALLNVKIQEGLQVREMNLSFIPNSIFDSWAFSQESQDKIKIQLYQTGQEIQYKNICFGDYVWIFHLQSGSFVKVIDEERPINSIILNKIKYALGYSLQTKKAKTISENEEPKCKIIIQKTQNEMSAQKFGLWKVVPVQAKETGNQANEKGKFIGGKIKFDQEVRFFNLKYKSYLSVRKIKKGRNLYEYGFAIQSTEQQNTVFRIRSLSSNSVYITTQDLFLLQNVSSNTYITLSVPFAINQTQARLTPSPSYKKQDNFKFTKVDFLQQWQNNNILSVIPYISEGIRALKSIKDGFVTHRDEVILRLLCDNLIELLTFSYDLTQGFEASESKLGKMTYNHFSIQKLLKEQDIIQKLIEVLDSINPNFLIQNVVNRNRVPLKMMGAMNIIRKYGIGAKQGSQKSTIKVQPKILQKLTNITLKILRNCCKTNTQNTLILFKNSSTIIKFLGLGTYAQNFIMDTFNNELILQRLGAEDIKKIINQYIEVLKITKTHSKRVFELLIKMIKIGDQCIGKNQLQIYRVFFYRDNPLMIPIEEMRNSFYVGKLELNQFCQQHPETANILGYQIKFCAEITANRNYVCSKTIKKIFPLPTILNYLIHNPVKNVKVKQSFVQLLIHSYLNQRPRFKKTFPLVFSIPFKSYEEDKVEKKQPKFQIQMDLMKKQGLNASIIADILSCIQEGDSMTQKDLSDLKEFILKQIQNILDGSMEINEFYSSTMESYLICLKFLIELSVFRKQEIGSVELIIQKIAKKVDESLIIKSDNNEKLESTNFRQLLLEMVQKNVIKKFNYSTKYDGYEDEVQFDNICSIFVNYSFYQNILLEEKDQKKRKQMDSVVKIVLQLIALYGQIKRMNKIKKFAQQLTKQSKMALKTVDKTNLIKQIIVDSVLSSKSDKTDIFNLLVLLFYNSNTYEINEISLNHLFEEIFSDRIAIQRLTKVQFNVDERQVGDFEQTFKIYKNIKLLIESAEIWLNPQEIVKHRTSKYDPVILLFISKVKQIIKIVMPNFDEDYPDPLFCCKFAKTIIPQKQQILANLNLHQQIMSFISEYRPLILKLKSKTINGYNNLLSPLFKICYLFMFVFIYDSPQNKNLIQTFIKEHYLRDYSYHTGNVDFGQSILIIEYLKNNYEDCIEFYGKNPQIFQKNHKYTIAHSKLLLTILNFYNEPILVNIRKFYISIFDFASFRTFLWFKPNSNELNLDMSFYDVENQKQPFLYHINAIEAILKVAKYIEQSRNTIRQHIKKSLSQQYLYSLLALDDFYSKQRSNAAILKVIIHFKHKIVKLIEFAYFSTEDMNTDLVLNQMRRQHGMLTKFLQQSPARQQNEDFKKIILVRDLKQEGTPQNNKIRELYENFLSCNNQEHILQTYLSSIDQFCSNFKQIHSKSTEKIVQQLVKASDDIHKKVIVIYDLLHERLKNFHEDHNEIGKYPVPYQWLLTISGSERDNTSLARKKYVSSFLIQAMFSSTVYMKFKQNQINAIKNFLGTLKDIQLKTFFFLRKISEFMEDSFEKLSNNPTPEMYDYLKKLLNFMTLWLQCEKKKEIAQQLRTQIGKSELIFPILNFFETCTFDKSNKQIFLISLQFFNELIGEDGNKGIQIVFNQYFTNKADSIEFFMKIKQLFDAINFEDRANYKCKRVYDSIQQLSKDSRLQKMPQFIILNFLIRLCKGNFRNNQIFLSSLSNVSNFNIMSGIWEILKNQSQKYKKNLINVENYHLITQCFSTIRELVEGPCVENQNQFLKRDFFLTVLDYFQFQIKETDLTLEVVLQDRLREIEKISPKFADKLRIYLNRDKITSPWMPSQVKYRCISLICSLLSQNVNQQSKSQLYTISPGIIIKELDRVYARYKELGLQYTYQNLEVKDQSEVVLPLGFKLYELLQYYPAQKLPKHSPGLDFFRANSRTVEVLHQKLCVVVFPHNPDEISQAYKQKFKEEVDRSSVNSKLRGLQDAQVQNKQSDYPYGYFILILATAITILDLNLYNQDNLSDVQYFNFVPIIRLYGKNQAIQVANSFLILCALALSIIFFLLEMKGAVYFKEHIILILYSNATIFEKIKQLGKFLWENLSYFHYLLTAMLCVLTIFNPFFDAILLAVELYRRSQTFSAIVNAIGSTFDQLFVVLLFTFVCTFVLTTLYYFYLAQTYFSEECATLYNCFVFSLDVGFRADSGFAGVTDQTYDSLLEAYIHVQFLNVLINFVYLLIIKVIIEQIIGAIMVDKFAQIRLNKEKLQEDEESVCFICGLERNLLDREQDGFEWHKQQYHNVWNYFQFLIHLRKSKLSSLSGIELFVYEQQKNGKLSWFPISRSYHMQLKNQQANQKQGEQNQMQKINKLLDIQVNQLRDQITQIWNLLNIKLAKQQAAKQ